MRSGVFSKYDVLILGAGVAASFAALRMLAFGFRPLIYMRRAAIMRGAEAVPETILRFERLIPIRNLLERAGAVPLSNFEVQPKDRAAFRKPGTVWHVDRCDLARAALAHAVERGAALIYEENSPVVNFAADSVELTANRITYEFQYAIDATGRAARWSRPVRREGSETARIFRVAAACDSLRRGKVTFLENGWAYRIDLPKEITVGIVRAKHASEKVIEPEIAEKLELLSSSARLTAIRPAFPQWSLNPCGHNLIAIGDAAFAHNPIAGQGIRFALSSAVAASVVLRTCRDLRSNESLALRYYKNLIDAERIRHLSFLEDLKNDSSDSPLDAKIDSGDEDNLKSQLFNPQVAASEQIVFSAPTQTIGVQRDDLILEEEAIKLEDGTFVRWLGAFDLLQLRLMCREVCLFSDLSTRLQKCGLSEREVPLLLKWCFDRQILTFKREK